VEGVGPLTALTFVLTLEDPYRFEKSRTVGAYLGLVPARGQSGDRDPQKHISKEGDELLSKLLVGSAHYILGPFGSDSDLRRHGAIDSLSGRKKRQETSGGRCSEEALGALASAVGDCRDLRSTLQCPAAHRGVGCLERRHGAAKLKRGGDPQASSSDPKVKWWRPRLARDSASDLM
jgi:Transposase IS116/IS110/IS902 family